MTFLIYLFLNIILYYMYIFLQKRIHIKIKKQNTKSIEKNLNRL